MATSAQKPETFLLSADAAQALPQQAQVALHQVDNLKYFLISAPVDWVPETYIRRFLLPTGEYVSCVLWNNLFHISGTDIVRCLSFRFQAFGRPVKNTKKFEEGIFSDLRNLKAGTDASLEEPKSPFLDFLYKNNCIRTQKKQKVFYWYSVPHDRLFLDALERDLKREKAGQEATSAAESEPALSFEFDASTSLYEQLTRAQQPPNATGGAEMDGQDAFGNTVSPSAADRASMPPPQMVPQAVHTMPHEAVNDMHSYSQPGMPVSAPAAQPMMNHSTDQFGNPSGSFEHRKSVSIGPPAQMQQMQRHNSVPAYMEYSPAPSFVSSQAPYDDYGARGLSYEPITPPDQPNSHGYAQHTGFTGAEDSGLYNALAGMNSGFATASNGVPPQQQQMGGQEFGGAQQVAGMPKQMAPNPVNTGMYAHIEGSPNYKQRRRRSPSPFGAMPAHLTLRNPHAAKRPSDLRRSISAAPMPQHERFERAASGPPTAFYNNGYGANDAESFALTPDHQQAMSLMTPQTSTPHHQRFTELMQDGQFSATSPLDQNGPGAFRRARSATVSDLSPYQQKSHSCPIPTCGRLFKRLEHLKRHVRTHTQERPYVCPHCSKAFSRSDNLAQHRRTHEAEDGHLIPDVTEDDDVLPDGVDHEMVAALDDLTSPESPEGHPFMGPPVSGTASAHTLAFAQQQQQQQPQQRAQQPQHPQQAVQGSQEHFSNFGGPMAGMNGAGQSHSFPASTNLNGLFVNPSQHPAHQHQGSMGPPPLPTTIAAAQGF